MGGTTVVREEIGNLLHALYGEVTDPALRERLRVIALDLEAASVRAMNGENVDAAFRALRAEASDLTVALAIRSATAGENAGLTILVRLLGVVLGAAV